MTGAPWLTRALADLGQAEIAGSADNPNIMAAFAACGHPEIEHETTAWCAAKMGHWLTDAGQPIPPRAVNLMARSYLSYGVPCEPKPGAIAVWPRGAPPSGHVNMVVAVLPDGRIRCIDGNYGDKVQFSVRDPAAALAFRWPVTATAKALRDAGSAEMIAAETLKRAAITTVVTAGAGSAAHQATAPQPVPTVPDVPALPDLSSATEQLTALQAFMEGVNAVVHLVLGQPWLAPAALGAGLAWFIAQRLERARIARAEAGAPLSREFQNAG